MGDTHNDVGGVPAIGKQNRSIDPSSIIIPDRPTGKPNTVVELLKVYKKDCGPKANKNIVAIGAISLCMEVGLNTQKSILGAIKAAGFNVGHAARLLKLETHHSKSWQQDVEGTFFLNDRARL